MITKNLCLGLIERLALQAEYGAINFHEFYTKLAICVILFSKAFLKV